MSRRIFVVSLLAEAEPYSIHAQPTLQPLGDGQPTADEVRASISALVAALGQMPAFIVDGTLAALLARIPGKSTANVSRRLAERSEAALCYLEDQEQQT